MKKMIKVPAIAIGFLSLNFLGCTAVDPVARADRAAMSQEGTVVFTRPAHFTPWFGNYSISQFIEITYERVSRNAAGQLVVEIGIRNRGPVSWTNWHRHAPEKLSITATCNFYETSAGVLGGPMLYQTNRRTLVINRGETYAYKAVCPVDGANGYQLVLGD